MCIRDRVYTNNFILDRRSDFASNVKENNLTPFKKFVEENRDDLKQNVGSNFITYLYDMNFDIFTKDPNGELVNTNGEDFEENKQPPIADLFAPKQDNKNFTQLISSDDGKVSPIITDEYEIVDGHWPKNADELVLFTDYNLSLIHI